MKPVVVITDTVFPDLHITREMLFPLAEIVVAPSGDERTLSALLREADGVINCWVQLKPSDVREMKRCKVISRTGIGLDTVPLAVATDQRIKVTNVPDYCLEEVADHTMALMLTLLRGVCKAAAFTGRGGWATTGAGSLRRLRGQTLGLVGFGRIARAVATRAQAFGLRTLACDPYVSNERIRESGAVPATLGELLARSDVISLHVPLTASSKHLVDANSLAQMKEGAIVVNTSRGGLIDFDALLSALRSGHLAGAGLDVLEFEPPRREDLVHDLDNLIVSPHIAFFSEESMIDLQRQSALAVAQVLRGEDPQHWVNRW